MRKTLLHDQWVSAFKLKMYSDASGFLAYAAVLGSKCSANNKVLPYM